MSFSRPFPTIKARSRSVRRPCPDCGGALFTFEGESVCQDCTRYEPVARPAPTRSVLRPEPATDRHTQR